jgi:hypothetical protein
MNVPLANAVELALVNVVAAAVGAMGNVYPGKSSGDKVLPCVICAADGSSMEEDPPRTGNFWIDFEITVKGTASIEPGAPPDPVIAQNLLVKTAFAAVQVDNLHALINAAAIVLGLSLTVFPNGYFWASPRQGQEADDAAWLDTLPGKLYCCGSVLTP